MIIVSQDKKEIINFYNVERIDITVATDPVSFNINYETNGTRDLLGQYETEERAKEVLKEIARFYRMYGGMKYFKDSIKSEILEIVVEDGQDAFVYTMPED